MNFENLVILILGWILGLFSPLIIDKIKEKKKVKELRNSIFIELDEFKVLIAFIMYQLEVKYNRLDIKLIEKLIPVFEDYNCIQNTDGTLTALKNFRELPSREFEILVEHYKTPGYLSLKILELPFLKSKLGDLGILGLDLQRQLLDIHYMVNLYNKQVEESKFFYKMTFDGNITDENHLIVSDSLQQSYLDIANRVKIIFKRIESLPK